MKLLKTLHRPDGIKSKAYGLGVKGYENKDPDIILCVSEYKLPSGKTGTCGAPAVWELIYKTGMRQPFGAPGNIMLHSYRCDLHQTELTT